MYAIDWALVMLQIFYLKLNIHLDEIQIAFPGTISFNTSTYRTMYTSKY